MPKQRNYGKTDGSGRPPAMAAEPEKKKAMDLGGQAKKPPLQLFLQQRRKDYVPAGPIVKKVQTIAYVTLVVAVLLDVLVNWGHGALEVTGIRNESFGVALLTGINIAICGMALGLGIYGISKRQFLYGCVPSYALLILVSLRPGFSDRAGFFGNEILGTIIVISFGIFFVLYLETSHSVFRFSDLETAAKTNEVYVMNLRNVFNKYLVGIPLMAIIAAVISVIAVVTPFLMRFIVSRKLSESLEMNSVYGVVISTSVLFVLLALPVVLDLSKRYQLMKEAGGRRKGPVAGPPR